MIFSKKSLGQNFLTDKNIIDLIVDIGNINENSEIIEVGPGNGSLTKKIIEKKPKNFIAIEKDEKLVELLNKKFKNNVKIINEDMMKISYENYLKRDMIIFGNLPYNI